MSRPQKSVLTQIEKRQTALTDEQLLEFKRAPKVLVAARINKEVYDWLMQYGKGYSTRINGILRTVVEGRR